MPTPKPEIVLGHGVKTPYENKVLVVRASHKGYRPKGR